MEESENIAAYLLRINENFNAIIGLGEEVNESIILQQVLRSLSLRYDAKVSAIEEYQDLTKMIVDELHKILTTYELRIETKKEKPTTREVAFKSSKKTRNKSHKEEETSDDEWAEK